MDSTPLTSLKGGEEHQAKQLQVVVWDLPTRVFHWLVVGLVALGWATAEGVEDGGAMLVVHEFSGHALAVALLFRLVWGVGGSQHSRFSDFVRPWSDVRAYAMSFLSFAPPRTVGHNPLGGWMVIVMLVILSLLYATGLFSVDDDAAGPLADTIPRWLAVAVSELHEVAFDALVVLIVVHVLGVVVHTLLGRDNLIIAMWTGRKTLPEKTAQEEERPVAAGWGLVVAVVAAAVVVLALI